MVVCGCSRGGKCKSVVLSDHDFEGRRFSSFYTFIFLFSSFLISSLSGKTPGVTGARCGSAGYEMEG
jgi:hypothetical protein